MFRWSGPIDMLEGRKQPTGVQLSDRLWWVSGGQGMNTSEVYDALTGQFEPYVDLPVDMRGHNMIRVNATHYVSVCNDEDMSIYMFDR